jgi:CubicO group peptidase (beta-lactamase class C family)
LLLDEGLIQSLDTQLSVFYPDLIHSTKGNITIQHILTHTSGLKTLGHDNDLSNASDIIDYTLHLEVETMPGTVSKYNNEAVSLISGIVKHVSGDSLEAYLAKKLFKPLGITRWEWLKDRSQNPLPYAGLSLTGLDLAKFAYLFLKKGVWENKKIIIRKLGRNVYSPYPGDR